MRAFLLDKMFCVFKITGGLHNSLWSGRIKPRRLTTRLHPTAQKAACRWTAWFSARRSTRLRQTAQTTVRRWTTWLDLNNIFERRGIDGILLELSTGILRFKEGLGFSSNDTWINVREKKTLFIDRLFFAWYRTGGIHNEQNCPSCFYAIGRWIRNELFDDCNSRYCTNFKHIFK